MERNGIMFGRNLQILRSKNGLSQQELADEIHVTRQTVSLWERGQGKPDIYYLHDICVVFGISVEQMMYGTVLRESQYQTNFSETKEILQAGEDDGYIENLAERGLYTFFLDDIYEFFNIIKLDIEDIIVIGLELHKRGYIVTEILDNGFSVVFLKDEEAQHFHSELYDIIDSFIHGDNEYIEERRTYYSDIMNSVRHDVIMDALSEIYGKSPEEFDFYWVDMEENPRGYADSEEECGNQARNQKCEKYKILPRV
ncbi:MAG: helix-turn-helix domain-containing protein [Lachnoclostridium sp.]|nr:helix-turn-helix domain-containing protein [Lachnospira sp.]MCM1249351.1 helix-turn-helix domain-containing protein [Lachnoclostridium sp.]MCM1535146.1 helix-turn-helix domain-containing protein [Clostridium sp.]